MLFLLAQFVLIATVQSINSNCSYEYWRLSVKTLSSSGLETYISSITLHDEEGAEITGVTGLYTNTGSNNNMENLFDENPISEYKFPQSGLPVTGDFVQWQCSPACNVDRVAINQSTGSNNIPEWEIMFSPQDFNFSVKWSMVTSSSPAFSSAPANANPCIYFNASGVEADSDSSGATVMFYVIIFFLIFAALLFLVVFYSLVFNKTTISNIGLEKKDDSVSYRHELTSGSNQNAPVIDDSEKYEAFLSHDWGVEGGNHVAVRQIATQLSKTGTKYWFNDERMDGSTVARMTGGIERSKTFVAFITQRYMDKVNGNDERDNCKVEFQYAFNHLGSQKMVAVVMESEIKDAKEWTGVLGAALGSHLYIDMVDALNDNEKMAENVQSLRDIIASKLQVV